MDSRRSDSNGATAPGSDRGAEGDDRRAGKERKSPWVESRAGGLFFVNSVLVAPELIVLLPLLVGALLRALGLLEGPSRFIDPIPRVAAHVLPAVGWLLVVPLWTTWRNLQMDGVKPWARRALYGMLVLHLSFLAYTLSRWLGGGGVG